LGKINRLVLEGKKNCDDSPEYNGPDINKIHVDR
jgi:hypothetical protein